MNAINKLFQRQNINLVDEESLLDLRFNSCRILHKYIQIGFSIILEYKVEYEETYMP